MVKRTIRATLSALGLIGLLLWTASCAVNPVSGQRELMLVSESDEVQLGGQADADCSRGETKRKIPDLRGQLV